MKVVMSTLRRPVDGTLNTHEECTVEIFDDDGIRVASGQHNPLHNKPEMKYAAGAALTRLDRLRCAAAADFSGWSRTTPSDP